MAEVTVIIAFIQDIGFIGVLIILAVPKLRRRVFGEDHDNHQEQIDQLKEHAKVANEEMGEIQESVSNIEKDVAFIKGKLNGKK